MTPDAIRDDSDASESTSTHSEQSTSVGKKKGKRFLTRFMMVARRTHLYAGLFLLPWVFLYGITGAMFNHQGLFPEYDSQSVKPSIVAGSKIGEFPGASELAAQVTDTLNAAAPDVDVVIDENPNATFTNPLMFELHRDDKRYVVHINPVTHSSTLREFPKRDYKPAKLLEDVHNIQLDNNPQDIAKQAAKHVFAEIGIDDAPNPRPLGWTKLNFMATVDGTPARITYVLKDGHVDVTEYSGQAGMSPRGFFLRLHTTHGQTPTWTGKMIWSVFVDIMAVAMVAWGVTGLLMWWQIKRTRRIGAIVMAASVLTAVGVYLAVEHFYATTML